MDIYFSGRFAAKTQLCDISRHPYRILKNCEVCSLQHSAVPINLHIFPDKSKKRSAVKSISKLDAYMRT